MAIIETIYLKRREMSSKKLISGDELLSQLRTDIGVSQTIPDLIPALGVNYMVCKPARVAIKPILLVTPSRHTVAPIRSGNDEGKYQQDEEETNEDGHAAKIEGQRCFLVAVGTDKASKRDKEDEETKENDWPSQKVDAAVVRLLGEPDASCHDGDGAEEGYEVENCCYVIGYSHDRFKEEKSLGENFETVFEVGKLF
ncbi:hypothetical protein GOBAR_DD03012 [Gossypium barbadense]|nr:hypothetical protein GOBAR_DD03012 [Gossypium barbadense]